jgi:hypothetical protein
MKGNGTLRTSTTSTNPTEGKSHHEAKFTKVFDGRKRAIRGLWKRNERFYAQLTVFDPITGKNRVQRISLLDKQSEPVAKRTAGVDHIRRQTPAASVGSGVRSRTRAKGTERGKVKVWVVADAVRRVAPASGRAVLVCR